MADSDTEVRVPGITWPHPKDEESEATELTLRIDGAIGADDDIDIVDTTTGKYIVSVPIAGIATALAEHVSRRATF